MPFPVIATQELNKFKEILDQGGYAIEQGKTVEDVRHWRIKSKKDQRSVATLSWDLRGSEWSLEVFLKYEDQSADLHQMLKDSLVEIPTL